jgi:hypothetical protein
METGDEMLTWYCFIKYIRGSDGYARNNMENRTRRVSERKAQACREGVGDLMPQTHPHIQKKKKKEQKKNPSYGQIARQPDKNAAKSQHW